VQNFIYIHDETTLQTNFQQVDKKRATIGNPGPGFGQANKMWLGLTN
jgi:hypothetical protein